MNIRNGFQNRSTIGRMRKHLLVTLLILIPASCAIAQSITVNSNLAFGPVFQGVPKTVSRHVPGEAAEFLVSGTPNAEITLDFELPTYMHTAGANMQLIFSTIDCALDSSASPDQTHPGQDNINPWHTITCRLGSIGLTVWLGGTVVPGLTQKPGDYSAIIVLTVAYTGN
jgi:hypothetical protein